MWPLLRAELAYARVTLAAAWSIALLVAVGINLLAALEGEHEVAAITFLPATFLIIASMIAGFVALGARTEERRLRLLLAGPMRPLEVGLVLVLVPPAMMAAGVAAAAVLIVLAQVAFGPVDGAAYPVPVALGGQFLAILQLGPLGGEAAAAWGQRRRTSAVAAWALFALLIAAMPLSGMGNIGSEMGLLPVLTPVPLVLAAAAATVALFVRRTDFTR